MPTTGTTATDAQEAQSTNTDSTDTTATDTDGTPGATADRWEGLPDEWNWTKEEVERATRSAEAANREAASRRVALRELEEKTKDAKTPEEFTAAMAEYTNKNAALEAELARERAARKHGLSDDLVEFLTASTEAEIETQAAKLAGLKAPAAPPAPNTTQVPLNGGVTPEAKPPAKSGRDAWREYKARR